MDHRVIDDTGIIALIDPDAYTTFVDSDWEYDQLCAHFFSEMEASSMLIWSTGMENIWRAEISEKKPILDGFRYATGFIRCTKGRLLLLSYDDLTYAAQFSDERLPKPEHTPNLISITPGTYKVVIVEASDHSRPMSEFMIPDYRIYIQTTDKIEYHWTSIQWD